MCVCVCERERVCVSVLPDKGDFERGMLELLVILGGTVGRDFLHSERQTGVLLVRQTGVYTHVSYIRVC